MQIKNKNAIGIFFLSLILLGQPQPVMAIGDAIIAIVEDEIITIQDLRDYIHKTYVSLSARGYPQDKLDMIMLDLEINGLDKLIEDKLILNEAKRKSLKANDQVVDRKVAEIIARYPSEQEFIEILIENGATISELKNKISEELKIKYMIENSVQSKIYITPQEITDYYKEHTDKFKKKERVDLLSIFVPLGRDKQKALEKSNRALKLIQNGDSFEDIAKEYSSTPSIGIVEKGQLLPKIEETIFNLQLGETSRLVKVDNGIFIFKLKEKIPAENASLEEVNSIIRSKLFSLEFAERFQSWIHDLKENAYIEIKKE